MTSPLPDNMALCTVRGRYGTWVTVPGQTEPQFQPYVGLQVRFTPAYPFITNTTATPAPLVVATGARDFVTDSQGYLSDPAAGNTRNCQVVASDDPDINPNDWKYLVTFTGSGAANFRAFRTPAPAGATIDMAVITPQRTLAPATQSEVAAAQAAASASQAQQAVATINRGQAGGVAPLDADGDVNDANGDKILGGGGGGAGASTLAGITDMSALARQLNTDTTAAAMRTRIGAGTGSGTSNLVIGTTAGTAADAAATATALAAKANASAVSNVNNTSDAAKPVSTAQAAALATKAPLANPIFTTPITIEGPTQGTHAATRDYADAAAAASVAVSSVAAKTGAVTLSKADVGLPNVDNTADTAKPISTAVQAALDGKVSVAKLVISATRPSSPPVGTIWIQDTTGADVTAPSAPTLAVPTVTATTVTLVWSGATDNVSVTGYDVYKNGVKLNGAPVTGTTYTDTGLTPSTSYGPYLIRARDSAGNISGDSNTRTISTSASGDTTAPSVPTGLNATPGNTTAALSWTASTDAVGVAGYRIYVNGTSVTTSATNSATLTGLTNGVTYSITVAAYDAANNTSAQSSAASVTPAAPSDTTAPTVPTGLSATPGNSQVQLNWTASTDAVGVTGYRIYVNGTFTNSSTTTSYLVTTLANGTSYSFTVAAYDAAGNTSAQSGAVNATPVAPSGQSYSDPFSRADVTAATAGSTALGNGWTVASGSFSIVSGQLKVTSNATTGQIANAQATDTSNMYVECTYVGGMPTGGELLIQCRVDNTVANYLAMRITSDMTTVSIQRMLSGALTTIGSFVTLGTPIVAGDVIRFEVNGTNLTGKVNGTTVVTGTSASVTTGTSPGVRVKIANNTIIDNVNWGDL